MREARMPGSLQPQSAREWQPDDVVPVGRGHEHPSLSLVVSSRCRAARAAGAASESPVSDSAPPAIDGDVCRGKQASGQVSCRAGDEGRGAVGEGATHGPARAGPTVSGPSRPDWHASPQLERVRARRWQQSGTRPSRW